MSDSKTQLILDLGALETLVTELRSTQASFDGLGNTAGEIAEQVGSQGRQAELAQRVRDFSSRWDAHRSDISQNVKALADEIAKIVEAVTKDDTELAGALTKPSAS